MLLVPAGNGGVVDVRARWLAPRLSAQLGQPVTVENKPGENGNVAMAFAARAAAHDGYTLIMVHQGTLCVNVHMMRNVGYSPLRDFIPITRVGVGPLVLAINPKTPVTTVAAFLTNARTKDGALKYASAGAGSPSHLAAELLKLEAGIKATHVPYKDGSAAAADVIAGHLDFLFESPPLIEPHVKQGRLRALAVTGPTRLALLPGLPTLREGGVPNYVYLTWAGIAAAKGTPAAIVTKVADASTQVLLSADARDYFAKAGAEPGAESPQVFDALVRDEYHKWGRVVQDAGIKPA
jgi:tripartite-type tricarboxylate transporter receptor subunit TctC